MGRAAEHREKEGEDKEKEKKSLTIPELLNKYNQPEAHTTMDNYAVKLRVK